MDLSEVEHLYARNQKFWETKYNKFINKLLAFVNKELSEFWRSIMSMGESIMDFCISTTHVHDSA